MAASPSKYTVPDGSAAFPPCWEAAGRSRWRSPPSNIPAEAWIAQKGGAAITPTSQVLLGGAATTATAADRFFPVGYYQTIATTANNGFVFPVAGTLSRIRFRANTPPTGTMTLAGTVQINGSSSALTCTITASSSPAGVCAGSTRVAVSAGDYAGMFVDPTNLATATIVSVSIAFTPTTANDTIIPSAALIAPFSTSATQVTVPFSGNSPTVAASRRNGALPDGGTIDKLTVASVAPGTAASGKAYDYTMLKNAAAQTPTCQILETATSCSDAAHSFTVAGPPNGTTPGDDIEFQAAPSNTPTASNAYSSVRYRPTTTGAFPLMAIREWRQRDGRYLLSLLRRLGRGQHDRSLLAERNRQHDAEENLDQTGHRPRAGKSRAYTLRVNGADTGLTCTVVDTNTGCSFAADVAVADNDLLDTSDVPTGSPALAGFATIAYLAVR